MLPSLKMRSSKSTPDLTQASTWSGIKCPAKGGWLKFSDLDDNANDPDGTQSPVVK